jgi:hypothetical protein
MLDEFTCDCKIYNDLSMPDNCDIAEDIAEHFGIEIAGREETISSDSIEIENVDESIIRKIKSVDIYFEDDKITETYIYGTAFLVFEVTEHFSEDEVATLKKLFRQGIGTELIHKKNIKKVYYRPIYTEGN